MNIDNKALYKKILEYWNQNDGKEFEINSLKEFFSPDELAAILYSDFSQDINYSVFNYFNFKIKMGYDRKDLISPADADRLFSASNRYCFILECCSQQFLFSLLD